MSNCPIVQLYNCPIVHFEQVRFEMAIMDYETGMNHNPQVSEIVSDNDDNDDDDDDDDDDCQPQWWWFIVC